MAKMKMKARVPEVQFDWEFKDGETAELSFKGMNTKQLDAVADTDGKSNSELLANQKKLLESNLVGDKKLIKKMLKELEISGNIYDTLTELNEAVGKQKKSR
jgi:hypothetical protein